MKRLNRILVVLLCAVWFFGCADERVIATVNNEKITEKEFVNLSLTKAKLLGVETLSPEQRKEVLDALIQREIVYLFAKARETKIPDEDFERATEGRSFLDRIFKRKEIEKNLLLKLVKSKVAGGIYVPREEVEEYYRAHKEEFTVPETYKVYLVDVREGNVEHVLQKLDRHPEAFDDMALERVSGELRELNRNAPYATKEGFPEEMWPSLDTMKVGEIAGPVEADRGMFLFKLIDKKPPRVQLFSEASMEINHLLTARKRDQSFQRWYEKIKGEYRVEIKIAEFGSSSEKMQ